MRSFFLVAASSVLGLQTSACVPTGQVVQTDPKLPVLSQVGPTPSLCIGRQMFAAWFSKQCGRSLSVKPDVMRADDLSKIFASSEFEHKDKDLCLSSGGMHRLVLGMLDKKASGSRVPEPTRWFISVCLQESSCKTSWQQYGALMLAEEQKALVLARCDPQIQGACERGDVDCCIEFGKNKLLPSPISADGGMCTTLRSALEPTK